MAGHDADMARGGHRAIRPGEKDEVAGLDLVGGDLPPERPLFLAGARDGDPGGAVGHHGQPGAVERVRPGAAPLVRLAQLLLAVVTAAPPSAQREAQSSTWVTYWPEWL
jgi:hypothetical protein